MTAEQYQKWTAPFRGARTNWVTQTDKVLTGCVYVAYPALLLWTWMDKGVFPIRGIWVPASWLVLVSLLRALIDRPRPYERLAIHPLIVKKTRGRSMPSRHVFSAFVLAMTAWWLLPPVGIVLTVLGVLLCITRVLGGVHDIWDVSVGALLGMVAGWLGYWVLP